MKKIRMRIFTLIIAASLFMGLSGCEFISEKAAIITIDGEAISDEGYYYFLYNSVYNIEGYFGAIDWTQEIDGVKITDFIKNDAIEAIKLYYAVHKKANELGYGLTEDQKAELEEQIRLDIERAGGQEAFEKELKASGLTEKLFRFLSETPILYNNIYDGMYGENGTNLPTESQLKDFADDEGYICATHILIMTMDENYQPYTEDIIAEKLSFAEEILQKAKNGEDFLSLMAEYGEDPGVAGEPHYYNFKSGAMMPEFEEAAFALGENEISGIVKTDYGFHIIKRLPLNLTELTESYCDSESRRLIDEWQAEITHTTSKKFDELNVEDFYSSYVKDLEKAGEEIAALPDPA